MKTASIRLLALGALACISLGSSACVIDSSDATLTIGNDSDYTLTEIRIARTDVDEPYGRNLIPAALYPGEEVTIAVDCDYYDVLLVDELDAECELIDFDLCFSDEYWHVTNGQLDACAQFALHHEVKSASAIETSAGNATLAGSK